MQEVIRARERELQGTLNPNLGDFGVHSEARQYSGRPAEEGWRCPFHAGDEAPDDGEDGAGWRRSRATIWSRRRGSACGWSRARFCG
jgi:hypothetical protein